MQKQLFTIVLQNSSQKFHKINRKIFGAASSFSSRNATRNENDDGQTVSGGSNFALANANKLEEIVVLNMFAEEIIRGKFNF